MLPMHKTSAPPPFDPPIPFTRPTLDEATIASVGDVLRSGWITSGPKVQQFESELSGFFGGLSGHQGALRAAFLARANLSKEAFIGTGVISAVAVDLARLFVYAIAMRTSHFGDITREGRWGLVVAASAAALAGSLLGARLINKVTIQGVRITVGVMLAIIGLALGAGLI